MDFFYTVVIIVAVIVFILMLTYIGLIVAEKNFGTNLVEYPPISNSCPDNWKARTKTDDNGVETVYCEVPTTSMKNTGTILDTSTINTSKNNAEMTYGYDDTTFTDSNDNVVGAINFNDPLWMSTGKTAICAKNVWASTYDIQWDGVSNYTQCDN